MAESVFITKPVFPDTRKKRPSIAEGEWLISVELRRRGNVLARSEKPLRIADSYLNGSPALSGPCLVGFIDDIGQKVAKKTAKRR